jgi:hypothetical protein
MNSEVLIRTKGCQICEDFYICQDCYDKGNRCLDGHVNYSHWNRRGTEAGQCQRALCPISTRRRVPCDGCGTMIEGVYSREYIYSCKRRGSDFSHPDCCSCNSDNFDLCTDCIVMGRTCKNTTHQQHYFLANYTTVV